MTQAAFAASYPAPPAGDGVIGEVGYETAGEEDTLVDVAARHRLGFDEIVLANPALDHWIPGAGAPVVLPTRYVLPPGPRQGIVVNLAEFRLYYYRPAGRKRAATVETYAISAGREDWPTPGATTHIANKLKNPAWYPNRAIRKEHADDGETLPSVVPPGPDNPLGPLALKLGIPGGYFIHGSAKAFGVGMRVTHGCLRLYADDMAALFAMVPIGTPVRVIDAPYKTGWSNGVLYLEAHPAPDSGGSVRADRRALEAQVARALRRRPGAVADPGWLDSLALEPRGVPLPVLLTSAGTS
jgi:L,D-transpeptidase ErfK/SrfK